MKTKFFTLALAVAAIVLGSCSKENVEQAGTGKLLLNTTAPPSINFKAAINVDNFNVKITNNSTNEVKHNNTVANSKSAIELAVGTYTVNVESDAFLAPAFSKPVYGATSNNIIIEDGKTTSATLDAKQTNAGVRIEYHADMVKYCSDKSFDYSASVTSTLGTLSYVKTETQYGYFAPGQITVKVTMNGKEYIQNFTLVAGDMKTITVNVVPKPTVPSQIGLSISAVNDVDSRNEDWTFDEKPALTATEKLNETFAGLTGNNTSTSGSATSWTGNTNFPTVSSAWQAGEAVKLGGSSGVGSITSKTLDLSANAGAVTVKFKVKGWSTVEGAIKVTIDGKSGTPEPATYSAVLSGIFEEKTVVFPAGTGTATSKVKIETTAKRAFIDDVKIIN